MIDRIEFHVSGALEYVEEAVKDTKKAMEYQRKARRVRFLTIHQQYDNLISLISLIYI